jgi:hypothetical protein
MRNHLTPMPAVVIPNLKSSPNVTVSPSAPSTAASGGLKESLSVEEYDDGYYSEASVIDEEGESSEDNPSQSPKANSPRSAENSRPSRGSKTDCLGVRDTCFTSLCSLMTRAGIASEEQVVIAAFATTLSI